MLFNSVEFFVFLPVVFLLYWTIFSKSLRLQNLFLVLVSYLFYGWWDWQFLLLLIFSSTVDFLIGVKMGDEENPKIRKLYLSISLITQFGILGFFKYFNFFVQTFVESFDKAGVHLEVNTLKIILPVGISFYTFQTVSYTIDVYRKKLKASKDPIAFLAFVSFFPQLVAGPIERATHLLPQINSPRKFSYQQGVEGARLILWGLFKKVIIADTCATYVGKIFGDYTHQDSATLFLGAVYFAFQIYGDFSGYSDVAIGCSKWFGMDLMSNFKFPYFSRDIAEFWRRWHISLSTWFRDYLYLPLGGSAGNRWKTIRNVMVIFIVSGFWHGANWTFITWGALNAAYFIPLYLTNRNRKHTHDVVAANRLLPTGEEFVSMLFTFSIVCVAWVFFRAPTVGDATAYLSRMLNPANFEIPHRYLAGLGYIAFLVAIEWFSRHAERHPLIGRVKPFWLRYFIYWLMAMAVINQITNNVEQEFIYFQF